MVSLIAATLLFANPADYWTREGVFQDVWTWYEADYKAVEAKDSLWVLACDPKHALDKLPADILSAPKTLYWLSTRVSQGLQWLHGEERLALASFSSRLSEVADVTVELIAAHSLARKEGKIDSLLLAYKRYREELQAPVINTNMGQLIAKTVPKNKRSQRFYYTFESRRGQLLKSLKVNFGIGVFVSDIPRFHLSSVAPKSAAEKAGFKAGDEIVNLNGKPVRDLIDGLQEYLERDNSELSVQVKGFNGSTRNLKFRVQRS